MNPKICIRKVAAEENKNIPHKYLIVRYLSATILIKIIREIQHWRRVHGHNRTYRNSPKASDTDKLICVGNVQIFGGIEN